MSTFFSSSHFPSNLIPLIFLPLLHNVVPLIILFCFHYILFSLLHPISISSSRTSPWQLLLPVYTLRIQKMTECKRTSLDLSSRPSSLSLDFFHSSFISSFHFSSCLSCNDQSATNCQNVITPVPQETPFSVLSCGIHFFDNHLQSAKTQNTLPLTALCEVFVSLLGSWRFKRTILIFNIHILQDLMSSTLVTILEIMKSPIYM